MTNKIKVLSLFSGIGAFEKALTRRNIPFELVGFSKIDKFAIKSYCAIHDVSEDKNLGDITRIDEKQLPEDIDLITYGFPCQDISICGKLKGLIDEDGNKTRSGLFFDALRIIKHTKPKVAIAENVKNLTSKKFKEQFQIVLQSLEQAGYNNYWKVLNAKDFGIPQNRERVFIVSVRKDIDQGFEFPEPSPLKLKLKDFIEDEVDEKYCLSAHTLEGFHKHRERHAMKGNGFGYKGPQDLDGIAKAITTKEGQRQCDNFIEVKEKRSNEIQMLGLLDIKGNEQIRRVYGTEGISPTLNTMQGGNRQPKILIEKNGNFLVKEATKKGYTEATRGDSINLEQPNSKTRRGRVGHGVAQTLTTSPQQVIIPKDSKIRKFTPKECFRLQGFDDKDFYKAEAVNSNTQLYKQAGNSIVVNVVEELLRKLEEKQKWLESEVEE